MGIEVAKHHLVVKVGAVVPGTGGRREDIHVDKSQCGAPAVGLVCQIFRRVEVGTSFWGKKGGTEEETRKGGL